MRPYSFGLPEVPKHRQGCNRFPNYPSTPLNRFCSLTSSTFLLTASRLDCTFFRLFLARFCRGPKKVLFLLPSPTRHVSCLPRIPTNPLTALTSLLRYLPPLKCLLFTKTFFFLMLFLSFPAVFFGVLIVPEPSLDHQEVAPLTLLYPTNALVF